MHAGGQDLHRLPRVGILEGRVGRLGVVARQVGGYRVLGDELDPARLGFLKVAQGGEREGFRAQAGLGRGPQFAGGRGEAEGGFRFLLEGGKRQRRLETGFRETALPDRGDRRGIGQPGSDFRALSGRRVGRDFKGGEEIADILTDPVERRLEVRLLPAIPILAQANFRDGRENFGPHGERVLLVSLQPSDPRYADAAQQRRHVRGGLQAGLDAFVDVGFQGERVFLHGGGGLAGQRASQPLAQRLQCLRSCPAEPGRLESGDQRCEIQRGYHRGDRGEIARGEGLGPVSRRETRGERITKIFQHDQIELPKFCRDGRLPGPGQQAVDRHHAALFSRDENAFLKCCGAHR